MITTLLGKLAHLTKHGQVITGIICAIFGESHQGFSVAITDEYGEVHIGWGSQMKLANEKDYSFIKPEKLPKYTPPKSKSKTKIATYSNEP